MLGSVAKGNSNYITLEVKGRPKLCVNRDLGKVKEQMKNQVKTCITPVLIRLFLPKIMLTSFISLFFALEL